MKRLDCPVVVKVKVTERFRISVNVHLEISAYQLTAEPSVTKLAMVMHHHGPKCYARRVVCCFQVQGHIEGLYNPI